MILCPCGSNLPYSSCCEPIHLDHAKATTPEKLMRSRYSAHVLKLVDYVILTYHPSCHAEEQRDAIQQSIESHWTSLNVVSAESSQHPNEGFVTFQAYLIEDGQELCLQERSRFVKENGLWYYIDGTFPDTLDTSAPSSSKKPGRNDPCVCGSGKKYKKCCG
ncbi:YchJ family protein [Vibrio sp. S4M6]|uniref:YchJ family protein n=1 Tax=Vibrio sinus TaxID=2946865 RepID=UPI002029B50D|nr:YchJ family protein [Vibrio sinus]MCL9782661.1 YchJ family protein [Vibrio sinus]